jgi:hypothetical protein
MSKKPLKDIKFGLPEVGKGISLGFNENKNEEEDKAWKSFWSMSWRVVFTGILGLLLILAIPRLFITSPAPNVRVGHREGDTISYVYQEIRHTEYDPSLDLEEAGQIAVLLDLNGNATGFMDIDEYNALTNKNNWIYGICAVGGAVLVVLSVAKIQKNNGKGFHAYMKESRKK